MTYVLKMRGAPVVRVRTYECDDCEQQFSFSHHGQDETLPECPFCAAAAKRIPNSFNITGIKAKAIDIAQQIMEEDYGMTDANDNLREGDTAFKGPSPVQTAEREAMVQQIKDTLGPEVVPEHLVPQVNEFWKNQQTPAMPPEAVAQQEARIQTARATAPQAAAAGEDPMALLHKAKPKMRLTPIGRQRVQDGKLVN